MHGPDRYAADTTTDADEAMSWENPEPPVLHYWSGLAALAAAVLLSGALAYVLLA